VKLPISLAFGTLLIAGLALRADDPAQKPVKPPMKEPTDKAKKPDEKKPDGQDETAKIFDRLTKNSKSAEERLKTDAGEETRKLQRDVLRDIDELLKQMQNPPQSSDSSQSQSQSQSQSDSSSSSGGGGGSSSSQSKASSGQSPSGGSPSGGTPSGGNSKASGQSSQGGAGSKPSGAQGRQQRREQREQQRLARGGAKGSQPRGGDKPGDQNASAKNDGGDKPNPQGEGPNGQGTEGGTGGKPDDRRPKPADAKLAELYKNPWGHLPETMRREMDSYFKEKFMPRYSELTKQYYSNIAEQNKK
jgi:hypothetical protein